LGTTAETYESVVSSLTTLNWRGPAAAAMAATAAPHVGWLYTTAEQTKQTAMQARAAAAAFEQAFAMTVPPMAIAANRMQLMALIATNFFGQNTAAIAATEAQYAEMWAQDAAAMYGYSSSSAAAAMLTPFTQPQQTTNPAGAAAQSAAVTQAAASVPNTLQGLTTGPIAQWLQNLWGDIGALLGSQGPDNPLYKEFGPDAQIWSDLASSGVFQLPATLNIAGFAGKSTLDADQLLAEEAPFLPAFSGVGDAEEGIVTASALRGGGGTVSAVLTAAKSIGPLSVPASWATPAGGHVSALSGAGLTTLPGTDEAVGSGMPGVPGMPAGTLARASGVVPRYGVRLTVMPRPPAAG
jgi:PPE-repeat protein